MTLSLLFYCRSGFENDCASEVMEYVSGKGVEGFVKAKPHTAHVVFQGHNPDDVISLWNDLQLSDLIFVRQILLCSSLYQDLPEKNRTVPLFKAFEENFSGILNGKKYLDDLFIEALDADEYKEVLTFCKKFTSPMLSELKKNGYIIGDKNQRALRLHILFLNGQSCYIGLCAPKKASLWFMGIPRLKFPSEAPSRSTLKLEEAFLTFLNESEREERLKTGMTAVDLGASPGGWTYQFVRRDIYVIAIDNGEMASPLVKTGLVEHLKEDGFKYRPYKPVDWLVCDMVERPSRIAKLIAEWAVRKMAREFIFNLKLPMKKKHAEVKECLNFITEELNCEGITFQLKCKHLYHDRDEVTVWLRLK
ncbi:23S rRNA (cytidine(2498)-2'-O)-methyltransferase RlmM [Silvanigrella aquatica]|uniref:23S rRNA (Cytidine(2498)-2'-O)-methyltransferase RlmM n=1 Tax=Silvanigrella aquatica TaxID=1915309 RepID=A0A1L4CYE2_9BACT|nr:23S rRNA (cytidine(2498)-2'-O)-methyltransferase RlmM [Silvanigrella aquatica]APJ02957.1 23S rRNA (cytidine(2498)-2'-O)-methyltransferase RlmM [Silvanigrella aquatica]